MKIEKSLKKNIRKMSNKFKRMKHREKLHNNGTEKFSHLFKKTFSLFHHLFYNKKKI